MNRIIVCIPTRDLMRTKFVVSLIAMQYYFYEWAIRYKKEDRLSIITQQGYQVDEQRNMLVAAALETEQTHLLFLDDDMVFPMDTIVKLLADLEHNADQGAEAVTGLYVRKNPPYLPQVYPHWNEEAKNFAISGSFPLNSLFKVAGSGMGCCLIKAEVFKRIERPWFLMGGEIDGRKGLGEDLYFCRKAKPLMLCDTRIQCEHLGEKSITIQDYIKSNNLMVSEDNQIQGTIEQFNKIGELYDKTKIQPRTY